MVRVCGWSPMSSRQYLIRRGNTWSATVEIPKPLRPLVKGQSRYVKALGTSNLAEANRLKLPLVAEWKRQIALLEKQGKPDPLAKIREEFEGWRSAIAATLDVWEEDEEGRLFNRRVEAVSDMLDEAKTL